MVTTTTIVVLQEITSSFYLLERPHDRSIESATSESLTGGGGHDTITLIFKATITKYTFSRHQDKILNNKDPEL